jgi:protein involved in polysaccharide export with SLBB domain
MPSYRSFRGRALLMGALLALIAPAIVHAGSPSGVTADSTLTDVLDGQTPGREAIESLKRSLTTPSAQSRWRGLPAFGRDLFRDSDQRFAPIENTPVSPDYVLGPGDNLLVYISSVTDSSYSLTLDREGKVFLPRIGATFLWGLSFADAEQLIRARIATVLRNARIQVSMGRVRALEVFVLGAVTRPGKYTLTGLATAFNAVSTAGGPSAMGSLRDIRVLRGKQEVARLDLYRFLLNGDRSNDARLEGGDVVFVGLIQSQIGIQGAVVRPAVYENEGPITLRALLTMAGGATAFADLTRIRIERVDSNGGFRLQDLPLDHGHGIDPDSLTLSNYDIVTVLPLNERTKNAVTLDGFVRHPGEYELTPGMKLSQLVAVDRMLPEAALDQAELRRVDPHTFQVDVHSISIRQIWSGQGDLELHPLDAVTVFSSARFPRSVTLDGEVLHPGTYSVAPGERLSSVLKRAGGVTAQGWLPAATFIRRSAATQERRFKHDFAVRQQLALAEQQARLASSGDTVAATSIARAQIELALALERQTDPGRVVLDLDVEGRWHGTVKDPMVEEGDRLTVPLKPATVTVLGSVMNPGTLIARTSASFSHYLKRAGGVSHQGDLSRSYVLKANGEAVPHSARPRVQPGDAIVVPPREPGGMSVGRAFSSSARFLMEFAAAAALVVAATR